MVRKRQEVPEVGDIIMGTVNRVLSHGAYVTLDEYGDVEGMIHISEIASSWVKNIRNHVREKQKVVVKVLRVEKSKGHIDLSLRRTTEQQRRSKIQEWKRAQKAENLLEIAASKLGKTLDEGYKEVGWKIEDKYGDIYTGLEEVKEKGIGVLLKIGITKKWADVLGEIVDAYVEVPRVKVSGNLELRCLKSDGIDVIKKALIEGLKAGNEGEEGKTSIYLVGSPRYRVEVFAQNYKVAERVLAATVEKVIAVVKDGGGEGSFKR